MSRILLASNPGSGHVRPGLPIARELIARGHQVVWYTSDRFKRQVERTGARHVGFTAGLDYDEADLDATFPERSSVKAGIPQLRFDIRSLFVDTIPGHMADLRALAARERFDAVVIESVFLAGAFLAEELDLPWGVYGIVPLTAKSVDCAPTGLGLLPMAGPVGRVRNAALHLLIERGLFSSAQRRLQEVRAELGLPRTDSFFLDYPMAHADVFIQGSIPELEYPRRDLPGNVRFVGALLPEAPGGADLPIWWEELTGDRPVILVTQGTVKIDPELLLHPAIEALKDEDVLIVATTGGADPQAILARHGADNVRMETFIPFADLLPHVDAVVCNGGFGGTQQALVHGIPVAVAGVTEGKIEVASRVGWSGAGINLRTETPTVEQIRTAVRSLLGDPSYRARARALQACFAEHDAPAAAAALVEALCNAPQDAVGRR
jgi:MGT family glycosyltransferase